MMDLLTLTEVSRIYHVSKVTLKKWEDNGIIKPITLGSRNKYIPKSDMEKLKESAVVLDENVLLDYKKKLSKEIREYSDNLRELKVQGEVIGEFEGKKFREILLKIFTTLNPGVDCQPDQYDTMIQFLSGKSIIELAKESNVTSPAIIYKINTSLKMLDDFCKTVRKSEEVFKQNEDLIRQNDQLKKKIKMLEAGFRMAGNMGVERKKPIDVLSLSIKKENNRLNNILSARCINALTYMNVNTIGELSRLKKLNLQSTPGLGKRSIDQIDSFLNNYGLELD